MEVERKAPIYNFSGSKVSQKQHAKRGRSWILEGNVRNISEIQSARNFHKSRWMEIHTTHNFRIPMLRENMPENGKINKQKRREQILVRRVARQPHTCRPDRDRSSILSNTSSSLDLPMSLKYQLTFNFSTAMSSISNLQQLSFQF